MRPYYQDDFCTIYHGDCREITPRLGLQCCFGFTDPPYNVGMKYSSGWNDSMSDDEYMEFCREWIPAFKQSCSEACVYPPQKYLLEYWNMLGGDYKQIVLTWSPEGSIRWGFVNQHASLLTNASPKQRTKSWWHNCQTRGLGYFFRENSFDHPGYTSEDVTGRVLSSFCPQNTTVFDPFCGTGTTLYCAKSRGLKAIGCELSESDCEIAARRLSQEVLPLQFTP